MDIFRGAFFSGGLRLFVQVSNAHILHELILTVVELFSSDVKKTKA